MKIGITRIELHEPIEDKSRDVDDEVIGSRMLNLDGRSKDEYES